jgi:hypothetical protein
LLEDFLTTIVAFFPQWQIVFISFNSSAKPSSADDPGNRLP